jgi:hypothetical protein
VPPMLFEILVEFYRERFPEEAEHKQITLLLSEFLIRFFESMQEELRIKYEEGENRQKMFKGIEDWIYKKY